MENKIQNENKEELKETKKSIGNQVVNINSFIMEKMKEVSALKKEFNDEQMKFVKNLINPDLTDSELVLFLALANKLQLNPFNKEIIAVVYSKNTPDRRVNTMVTRDGKRVVASRQGGIDSIFTDALYVKKTIVKTMVGDKEVVSDEVKKVEAWEGGTLWGATCLITRNGKTFQATVPFAEYNTGRNVWASKPSTMIKKVAESQALSLAFPEVLGGVYDEDEMPAIESTSEIAGIPAMVGGESPATPEQVLSIKSLGGEAVEGMTKQQAANTIKSLVNLNPKK